MRAVRIVGIGSPHGADAAGWVAIDALRHAGLVERFPVGLLSLHQCGFPAQLPQLLAGGRCVIVIDAVPGHSAGVRRVDAAQLQNRADLASVHGVGVGEMLALIATLETSPPAVTVLGIGVDPQASSGTVQRQVNALLPDLLRGIGQTVAEFLAASKSSEEKYVGPVDN